MVANIGSGSAARKHPAAPPRRAIGARRATGRRGASAHYRRAPYFAGLPAFRADLRGPVALGEAFLALAAGFLADFLTGVFLALGAAFFGVALATVFFLVAAFLAAGFLPFLADFLAGAGSAGAAPLNGLILLQKFEIASMVAECWFSTTLPARRQRDGVATALP